jgi:hypothetical protein
MTTYCCGIDLRNLKSLELPTVDVWLKGKKVVYTSKIDSQWSTNKLATLDSYNEESSYEDTWSVDEEETKLVSGDTVICDWWVNYRYVHLLRKDNITVIVIEINSDGEHFIC